jgi:acetyltransferase-like isoleucine patch superfamily enzyme
MRLLRKALKISTQLAAPIFWRVAPAQATKFLCWSYKKQGMKINGTPNYISAKVWFDGTDYGMIELNEGCTISSNVRILTHDWSINTVAKSLGYKGEPQGIFRPVKIGPYSFVGTGSIIMPGCELGQGAVVGAGSVVRGKIEPYAIMVGSPATKQGDSREYTIKQFARLGIDLNTQEQSK